VPHHPETARAATIDLSNACVTMREEVDSWKIE
jgi:hypothetical protein